MFEINVSTHVFTEKIRQYQELTGKGMGEVVREQARLLAVRLTQLTYPKTAAVGKRRVAIDIARVYLQSKWFEEVFQFRNESFGDRVKEAVRAKDVSAVETIFAKSAKLRRIHVEPFDRNRHASLRRDGRIKIPNPNSFPVAQQGQIKKLETEKKRNVGMAKSGWAVCAQVLGSSQASWLNKSGTGAVVDKSSAQNDPHIVLTNKVSYFSRLDSRASIVSRALEGRAATMVKAAENALRRAARAAQLNQ